MRLFTALAVVALVTAGCEKEDISTEAKVYTYEFESVDLVGLQGNPKLWSKSINDEMPSLILSSKLESNIEIPQQILNTKDVVLFEEFLNKNKKDFDGKITFYFNGVEDETFIMNSQNLTIAKIDADEYPRRNECSVEGVRQCTKYNIYEGMNTFEKIVCAFAGFACIAEEGASCTAINCLGDRAPNDQLKK